jgi:hypothetical protein
MLSDFDIALHTDMKPASRGIDAEMRLESPLR